MFISITGKPGSGKSYWAAYNIHTKKDDYYNIYTNINGMKLGGNVQALNFNYLLEIVKNCKEIYDSQVSFLGENQEENIIDAPIVQYLLDEAFIVENPAYQNYLDEKKQRDSITGFTRYFLDMFKPLYSVPQYKPTAIFIDEAQNHFPSKDRVTGKDAPVNPIISWWISYHRHLFMDVYLLSQSYQKIHSTYLRDIEYFLYAVPSDRQLFATKFQYRHHLATPFFKTNLVDTIKLPKLKEVFATYDSGDKVRTNSIIKKYALVFIFLIVLVLGLFSFAVNQFSGSSSDSNVSNSVTVDTKNNVTVHHTKNVSSPVVVTSENFKNLTYIKFNCFDDTCINRTHNIELSVDDLNSTVVNTNSKILSVNKKSSIFACVSVLASEQFLHIFQGAKNEKNGLSILSN